jgi:hypothetical protein
MRDRWGWQQLAGRPCNRKRPGRSWDIALPLPAFLTGKGARRFKERVQLRVGHAATAEVFVDGREDLCEGGQWLLELFLNCLPNQGTDILAGRSGLGQEFPFHIGRKVNRKGHRVTPACRFLKNFLSLYHSCLSASLFVLGGKDANRQRVGPGAALLERRGDEAIHPIHLGGEEDP